MQNQSRKRRQRTEVQEWCFGLMNDPEYFEKWRYKDTINDYNSLIAEFQKLYEQTLTTNHFMRARIQSGMKKSKRDLAKTQAEYEIFKKYKMRTAISK
jgi:hypothetical protein